MTCVHVRRARERGGGGGGVEGLVCVCMCVREVDLSSSLVGEAAIKNLMKGFSIHQSYTW